MKFLKRLSGSEKDKTSSTSITVGSSQFPYSIEDNNNNNVLDQFVYTPVLRIQQVWRKYRDNQSSSTFETPEPDFQCYKNSAKYCTSTTIYGHHHQKEQLDNRLYCTQDLKNNNIGFCDEMSTNFPLRYNSKNSFKNNHNLNNAVSSDCSQVNETLTDHLANVMIVSTKNSLECINKSLDNDDVVSEQQHLDKHFQQKINDDINIQKQVRKTNLLSLAQEFAALKKMNSCVLPFDLHHEKYKDSNSLSDTASETDDGAVNDITMMTVSNISINSNVNTVSQFSRSVPSGKYPENIDKNIAIVTDYNIISNMGNNIVNNVPDVVKVEPKVQQNNTFTSTSYMTSRTTSLQPSSRNGTVITITNNTFTSIPSSSSLCSYKQYGENVQKQWSQINNREEIRKKLAFKMDEDETVEQPSGLFYVNETATDHETINKDKCDVTSLKPDIIPSVTVYDSNNHTEIENVCSKNTDTDQCNEDFFSKQARLQTEAKMALAQVRPMAHMQLQLEKQRITKSPLADIVGMPGYYDGKQIHLNVNLMNSMNIAQLQVVVNDLHARIEELNIELMQQLVSRDDLHMAQDSMLIDIEDLTGRAQEFAARVNKKMESSKYI